MTKFQEYVDENLEQARVLAVEAMMLQKSGRAGTRRWEFVMDEMKALGLELKHLTDTSFKQVNRWARRRALKRILLCR